MVGRGAELDILRIVFMEAKREWRNKKGVRKYLITATAIRVMILDGCTASETAGRGGVSERGSGFPHR